MNAQPHPDEGAVVDSELAQASSQDSQLTPNNQEVPIHLELALIRTLAMLQQSSLASAKDCSLITDRVRSSWERGLGADPIIQLARIRAGGGEMLDESVEVISSQIAYSLPHPPTRVPFAARLIPPSGLYEKHPEIYNICKLLLVPIAFAEDLDVMGVASINPYFADALSIHLAESLKKETGIEPLIQCIRLDYLGWAKMCQKHFRQEV